VKLAGVTTGLPTRDIPFGAIGIGGSGIGGNAIGGKLVPPGAVGIGNGAGVGIGLATGGVTGVGITGLGGATGLIGSTRGGSVVPLGIGSTTGDEVAAGGIGIGSSAGGGVGIGSEDLGSSGGVRIAGAVTTGAVGFETVAVGVSLNVGVVLIGAGTLGVIGDVMLAFVGTVGTVTPVVGFLPKSRPRSVGRFEVSFITGEVGIGVTPATGALEPSAGVASDFTGKSGRLSAGVSFTNGMSGSATRSRALGRYAALLVAVLVTGSAGRSISANVSPLSCPSPRT